MAQEGNRQTSQLVNPQGEYDPQGLKLENHQLLVNSQGGNVEGGNADDDDQSGQSNWKCCLRWIWPKLKWPSWKRCLRWKWPKLKWPSWKRSKLRWPSELYTVNGEAQDCLSSPLVTNSHGGRRAKNSARPSQRVKTFTLSGK
ncbi:hypothetical protein MANES_10G139509v8 [Manihot esculenta]|uniref:Uncharacterized protein n=1 Tax=Manihot esculenta TaxID=3983 RepID=A0ACB7H2R0_MANES|nr:hypothetical protein MANES_10G139509v8 [Manihot esculenta]